MKYISLITLISLAFCIHSCSKSTTAVELARYQKGDTEIAVFQSDMGGGGYITGMVQDPQNSNTVYARCDVAGVFKSIDGGKSWKLINNGLNKMSDHYCHSLAIDPFNHKNLIRASGDVRNFEFTGRLHRTIDGGKTWHLVQEGLDYYGNGPTRTYGELVVFNPQTKGEVAAGSFSKGVWFSSDHGKNWQYIGLEGERIASVQFNQNKLYVTTISDMFVHAQTDDAGKADGKLRSIQDYARNNKARIYVSDDKGKNWDILYENKQLPAIYEMLISEDGKTMLFISVQGVYRSIDGGKTFQPVDDLPVESRYRTITQSPLDSNRLYTAEVVGREGVQVPIYESNDFGKSWHLISPNCQPENLSKFPNWHSNNIKRLGDSRISHILPDNKNPNKLYISNWWGVTITEDMGNNYCGNNFEGIGVICCEALLKHPTRPNEILTGICDHAPTVSTDGGNVFRATPVREGPARTICYSKYNPDLMIFAAQTKGYGAHLFKSEDSGATAKEVWTLKDKNFIQVIKDDPLVPGRFWLLLEGDSSSKQKPGIYVSNDWGDSWHIMGNDPFQNYESLPLNEYKVESDLMPIVNYQYKNGCGTGQLITLDYHKGGVVYVGEWTTGIYRSMDSGNTWNNIGTQLPFNENKNQLLQFVYTDPYRKGIVYAGLWNAGLWKSTDFGDTWQQVTFLGKSCFNASSMSIDRDADGNELMTVASSNHPLGDYDTALWISSDNGQTWKDIYDNSIGCTRFIAVANDVSQQRIYAATAGTGVIYFDLIHK